MTTRVQCEGHAVWRTPLAYATCQPCGYPYAAPGHPCPNCGKKLKFCFITTAVTHSLGLPDDCAELTEFRRFRDGYMARDPRRAKEVLRYYEIAPAIVAEIERSADPGERYRQIYVEHLRPALACVESGDNSGAYKRYRTMVEMLTEQLTTEAADGHC